MIIRRGDDMGCYEQCMGNQLIILSTLLSLVISDNLSSDQLNTLGNFIVAVGSLMLTKAAEIQALDLNKIILWLRCSNK